MPRRGSLIQERHEVIEEPVARLLDVQFGDVCRGRLVPGLGKRRAKEHLFG
jgi:hypothetical protein